MTSVAAEYQWLAVWAIILTVAFCLLRAGINYFRAVLLARYSDIKNPDPIIAAALEEAVPPPYALYALNWAALAVLGLTLAYFVTA